MRRASDIDIALLPPEDGETLQRWLYRALRSAILSGQLGPGARLPTTRDLAQRCGVSRGTVVLVFDQLTAEGYLHAAVGKGSFVAARLPDAWNDTPVAATKAPAPPGDLRLSQRGQKLVHSPFQLAGRKGPTPAFRASQPDLEAFPIELWTRIAARRARLHDRKLLYDGEAGGYAPLRAAIVDYLARTRGIVCSAEQVVIAGSVQQLLDIAARLLLDENDAAWIENPGYPGARHVLQAAGAQVIGIPVDHDGLDVAAGVAMAPQARLAYVTAGRHAPLGMPLSLPRRLALLSWARECGATIFEDDYDSEYRFNGAPLAALKSLDQAGRVIYAGTFSKLLFPALRIAYAVLPEAMVAPFHSALSLTSRFVPLLPQAILHEFIADGHLGRHIRRMRLIYAERAQALQHTIEHELAGWLTLPPIQAGLDATALLPDAIDDSAVSRAAWLAGIETRSLSSHGTGQSVGSGLVLGFAAITPETIARAGKDLAQVLHGLPRPCK